MKRKAMKDEDKLENLDLLNKHSTEKVSEINLRYFIKLILFRKKVRKN